MVVRALSGSGGSGGGDIQHVATSPRNNSAYTITNLEVGKKYLLVCITDSSVSNNAKVQVTVSNITNATYEEIAIPDTRDISAYVACSAYKITPNSNSITVSMQSYTSFYMLFEVA